MKSFNFFILIIVIFFNLFSIAYSKESIAFINLDELIKNNNYGKIILDEIKSLNEKNLEKLQKMENELKFDDEELNNKKNIISKEDFDKQLSTLNAKIVNYRKIKEEMTKNFQDYKNKNLNAFFLKINPIIQTYMDEKSIEVLLRQENIFIGKNSADITDIIIKKINTKIN